MTQRELRKIGEDTTLLDPETKEKALKAFDDHYWESEYEYDSEIEEFLDSFDWSKTEDGYTFWDKINQNINI